MQRSSFNKWLVTLVILIVIAGAIFHLVKSGNRAQDQKQRRTMSSSGVPSEISDSYEFHPYYLPSVPRPTNGEPDQSIGTERLPREKVEAWLAQHNRDAGGLLAAFRAMDDTNYLNETATNFPNNPQVELAILARDEFPADRRKWLDLFKASSPTNSLANYLSAEDYFKNGNTDAAIQELLAATGKSQFEAYGIESQLEQEELAQFCGMSALEADNMAMTGFSEEELPELATFKRLAQGIRDSQQQYLGSGDAGSAANLAQMGMQFGNQIEMGDSGKYLINQLVGIAIEAVVLDQLNPNTSYDFLGGKTPSEVMQENKQFRQSFRQLVMDFEAILPTLTDNEKADYFEREQNYGEVAAKKWVIQQHPASNH